MSFYLVFKINLIIFALPKYVTICCAITEINKFNQLLIIIICDYNLECLNVNILKEKDRFYFDQNPKKSQKKEHFYICLFRQS